MVRNRARRGRHFPVMRVIPPGLDFSNLKIAPPPDPLAQLMPAGGSLKSGGGSGNLTGRGPRRSSASSSYNHLASAAGEELAPAGVGDSGGTCSTSCSALVLLYFSSMSGLNLVCSECSGWSGSADASDCYLQATGPLAP